MKKINVKSTKRKSRSASNKEHHKKKVGQAPGVLIFSGEQKVDEVKGQVYSFNAEDIDYKEGHSVKEFMEKAFSVVNLDWQKYVKINKKYNRPLDINLLLGDASKAKNKLGWEPKVKFDQLVEIMVKEDLLRWERFKKGEHFPWDASNYMSETKILTRSLKT